MEVIESDNGNRTKYTGEHAIEFFKQLQAGAEDKKANENPQKNDESGPNNPNNSEKPDNLANPVLLVPTTPSQINLKKIGESYYTNITYEENYYDLRFTRGVYVMNVDIPSLNVMFSARKSDGTFRSMEESKELLAEMITLIRYDIGQRFLNYEINNGAAAADYFVKDLNIILNGWFGYGQAALRTPTPWIGSAKSNLIYLLP